MVSTFSMRLSLLYQRQTQSKHKQSNRQGNRICQNSSRLILYENGLWKLLGFGQSSLEEFSFFLLHERKFPNEMSPAAISVNRILFL